MAGIVSRRLWFFLFSAVLIVVCVVSLAVFGLKLGLDFAPGSELTLDFVTAPAKADIEQALTNAGYASQVEIDTGDPDIVIIKTRELSADERKALEDDLVNQFGVLDEIGIVDVDNTTAAATAQTAIYGVLLASLAMLIYISWAFHRMPKPFHYGTCAVIAILHDIIVVLGIFSILGVLASWEIDLAMVTGMLTVVGYAVNDSIVVFDRIRENVRKHPGTDFEVVVNNSLMETMSRSLITGAGVIFVLVALLLFLGTAISNLAVVLLVGILVGTYTSICVAAPLLVAWEKRKWGRLFPQKQSVQKPA